MGTRRDRGCVGLTVDCRDLPGAAADTAEAPIAPTQGGVGKVTIAAAASAITSFDRSNRASTIEHGFDRSRRNGQPALRSVEKRRLFRLHLIETRTSQWLGADSKTKTCILNLPSYF
jgi:hypothetical protein